MEKARIVATLYVTMVVCSAVAQTSNPADINNDGVVNMLDQAILSENWLWGAGPSEVVLIPGGTFQMGDSFGEGDVADGSGRFAAGRARVGAGSVSGAGEKGRVGRW